MDTKKYERDLQGIIDNPYLRDPNAYDKALLRLQADCEFDQKEWDEHRKKNGRCERDPIFTSDKKKEVKKMEINRVLAEVEDICGRCDFYDGCTIDCPLKHLCSGRQVQQKKR